MRLRPMARVRGTIGVVQNRPMRTPGVANRAVTVDIEAHHLRKILARAENLARGGQDEGAHGGIAAETVEAGDQIGHQGERKGVAPLGAVEGNDGGRPVTGEGEVLHAPTIDARLLRL